jgi:hypothetical protein
LFEERSVFRQRPELIQEKWHWQELKNGQTEREFAVNFLEETAKARIARDGKDFSARIDIKPGRTFAGFGFTLALSNLRDRLLKGESIELEAIGFTPKPRVVTVNVSHVGLDRIHMGGRIFRGDNFAIRPAIPAIAKWFVHAPDNRIWLTNPAPATFLRWEGPIVLPSDPIVRVDLVSDERSHPAEPAKTTERE